jgi:hypothetical protein
MILFVKLSCVKSRGVAQRIAERDLAASALSAFFGLGLTGDKVPSAKPRGFEGFSMQQLPVVSDWYRMTTCRVPENAPFADRDLAASALSAFLGLGLTGDKVPSPNIAPHLT